MTGADRGSAAIPHTCSCDGCWACDGHEAGCTCDVDWDALAQERIDRDADSGSDRS